MKDLLGKMLSLTISTLYIKLRGKVYVKTLYTENDYLYTFTETKDGTKIKLDFKCKQIQHRISYEKWKIFNSIKYTYVVEVIRTVEDKIVGTTVGYFPHMCSKLLHGTKHPHRFAINAMIDCFR